MKVFSRDLLEKSLDYKISVIKDLISISNLQGNSSVFDRVVVVDP